MAFDRVTGGHTVEVDGNLVGFVVKEASFRYFAYDEARAFVGEANAPKVAAALLVSRFKFNQDEDTRVSTELAALGVAAPETTKTVARP